jgi:ABC-2 type transport system permease protein
VAVGVMAAVGFVAQGYPTVGSLALAGSMTTVGLVFVGVTAVAAQLTGSSRACLGMGSLVLLVAFVVRAIGDIGGNFATWVSPIGWAQGVRAFAGERWWTLAAGVTVAVALVMAAFWLSTLRDMGSGLVGVRPGPDASAPLRRHPLTLPVRLQRGALVGWLAGLFTTGVVYGSFADSVDAMVVDNPQMAEILAQVGGASITDSYFATAVMMLALVAGGLAISSTMAPNTEERAGRADVVLAGPVSRHRWFASYLITAVVQTVVAVAVAGLGVGVAYAVVMDDPWQTVRLAGAAMVTVPAVLVLLGITAALYGLAPRAAVAAWAPLALAAVVGFFGELLRLPQWIRGLSPFHHLPKVPAEDLTLAAPLTLLGVAALLVAAGLWGLGRRDLAN